MFKRKWEESWCHLSIIYFFRLLVHSFLSSQTPYSTLSENTRQTKLTATFLSVRYRQSHWWKLSERRTFRKKEERSRTYRRGCFFLDWIVKQTIGDRNIWLLKYWLDSVLWVDSMVGLKQFARPLRATYKLPSMRCTIFCRFFALSTRENLSCLIHQGEHISRRDPWPIPTPLALRARWANAASVTGSV